MEAEQATHQLKAMLEYGVFMDPLLMNTYYEGRALPTWEQAEEYAKALYLTCAKDTYCAANLGDIPFSPRLLLRCLVETVMSTAVQIANESSGSVIPIQEELDIAEGRVARWIDERGIDSLYQLYFVVAGYDFLQPMFFHKHVYEADFLNGTRHYPYTPDALDTYVMAALARGSVRLKATGKGRVIQPTKVGVNRYHLVRQSLEESGYLEKRIAMSYVYQFDAVQDWDKLCDIVWPDAKDLRRNYLTWVGIRKSDQVLEVACGTGALTFDGGLFEMVEAPGHVTAIDISAGMLDQAQLKFNELGQPQCITLNLASVERLPYPDNEFDISLGSAFLHFTDAPRALAEMKRVVKPGGLVSILQALATDMNLPFFNEWFQPILVLAKKNKRVGTGNYLPTTDKLRAWFTEAGLHEVELQPCNTLWVFDNPEAVVQHIVRGVSFFQAELVYLPWDDQRTLIMELIDRGRDVCRKYPRSERIIELPSVRVRGKKL